MERILRGLLRGYLRREQRYAEENGKYGSFDNVCERHPFLHFVFTAGTLVAMVSSICVCVYSIHICARSTAMVWGLVIKDSSSWP